MENEKENAVAINSIAKTEGYKAILSVIDVNIEAYELIATDINNADRLGTMAFANGGIEALKRAKMQITDLAALAVDITEPTEL